MGAIVVPLGLPRRFCTSCADGDTGPRRDGIVDDDPEDDGAAPEDDGDALNPGEVWLLLGATGAGEAGIPAPITYLSVPSCKNLSASLLNAGELLIVRMPSAASKCRFMSGFSISEASKRLPGSPLMYFLQAN